jgi:hypothetical protein
MRAGDDVGDDLGSRRIRDRRLEDADDGRGAVAEPDRLAEQRAIAAERRRPEAIGQDARPARAFGPSSVAIDQPADDRRSP